MMMKATRRLVLSALVLCATMLCAGPARAHSFPHTQSPAAGQTLTAPPPQVTIKFDAPVETLFAKLEVFGPDGGKVPIDAPHVGDDGRTLSAKLPTLKPGEYLVKWSVVGKDTHRTQGSYQFKVADAPH